ncbi:MAG TPA: type II secretion system F family protein [Acidobacteriota bacterium]
MPNYSYRGQGPGGKALKGVMVAANKNAVVAALRKQRIVVTSIKERGKEISLPKLGGRVRLKELAIFTRQLSVMIDAGLPLVQCLEILGSQQTNKFFQSVLFKVRSDVEAGSTFTDALRQHPAVFNELFCSLIAAGEVGGILDAILQRLAMYIEKSIKLRRAVRSALIYPTAVITIASLVVAIILWKVIPTFAALFAGLGAQLPLPTRIVIAISQFFAKFFLFMLGGAILLMIAMSRYYRTPRGRRMVDRMLLRLPVVGLILRKIAVARFCRTLGTLTSSGVPILDGLNITAHTAGNAIVEDAIRVTRKGVEEGKTLAEPLRDTEVFPPMVVQMISVGEQTGELDTMLSKIADFYEDEVDASVENLISLLEPLMILFLGVVIGGIVISMYLPLFDLIQKLG